jgi:hypothetical protein
MKAAGLEVESNCDGLDLRGDLPLNRELSAWQDEPVATMTTFTPEVIESGGLDRYKRELHAAIGPRYKAIKGSDDSQELFDIRADPRELQPLDAAKIGAAALKAMLDAIAAAGKIECAGPATAPAPLDPQALEALKGLGYIGEGEKSDEPKEPAKEDERPR